MKGCVPKKEKITLLYETIVYIYLFFDIVNYPRTVQYIYILKGFN